MPSLQTSYITKLSFSPLQAATLRSIGAFQGQQALFSQQIPETLETLRHVALVESTESSNRIEGIVASRERIQDVVLHSHEPIDRSEQEIAGYRDGLKLIHDSAEHMPFSVNEIKQLHSILYRYLPQQGGGYKATQNDIVETNPDGSIARVRFKPSSPVVTPQQMEDLARQHHHLTGDQQIDALIVIPLVVLDFLCIHPFSDGNGRISRLISLWLLYQHGYQVGRYISLERLFEESKDSYYETLEASSYGWHEDQHDPYPWMDYFWGVLLKAYKEFSERVGVVKQDKGSKTDMLRADIGKRFKPFAISDLERAFPTISRDMIRVVLRQLKEEGLIYSTGKGRGAKWVRHSDSD